MGMDMTLAGMGAAGGTFWGGFLQVLVALSFMGILNNLIGGIAGVSPATGLATTINSIMPIMIQMMPWMMVMNMISGMMTSFMRPMMVTPSY
jgi:hypothetical protein